MLCDTCKHFSAGVCAASAFDLTDVNVQACPKHEPYKRTWSALFFERDEDDNKKGDLYEIVFRTDTVPDIETFLRAMGNLIDIVTQIDSCKEPHEDTPCTACPWCPKTTSERLGA